MMRRETSAVSLLESSSVLGKELHTVLPYRMCSRCVMDTSDPEIQFDEHDVCSHCHTYDQVVRNQVLTGEEAQRKLERMVAQIQRDGKRNQYDCIIGVSGGVDSTFVAYKTRQLGLRPLAVHLDNGWDSELAVKNIEQALKELAIDLYTHVLDWDEFKDIQLAFLRASTPDSEIPTDHAIIAILHRTAEKIGVKYILAGVNARTESHLPRVWSQGHFDWKYIYSVHKRFGTVRLRSFPHLSFWTQVRYSLTQEWINILNYLDYVKKDAMSILEREIGWRYYGGKHYESIYTRFYQGYILPRKFGYDKRRTHLSSLVCSGEITREQALRELVKDPYARELQEEDRSYVLKKFGLTSDEFETIIALPIRRYEDYPNYLRLRRRLRPVGRCVRGLRRSPL